MSQLAARVRCSPCSMSSEASSSKLPIQNVPGGKQEHGNQLRRTVLKKIWLGTYGREQIAHRKNFSERRPARYGPARQIVERIGGVLPVAMALPGRE